MDVAFLLYFWLFAGGVGYEEGGFGVQPASGLLWLQTALSRPVLYPSQPQVLWGRGPGLPSLLVWVLQPLPPFSAASLCPGALLPPCFIHDPPKPCGGKGARGE